MRIVFMGTPDFARIVLESLVNDGHEIIGVYTQPDRPKGRSGALSAPPVKEYALSQGLPVHQPERIRRPFWPRQLTELAPDVIVVAAFGQLLPSSILEIAPCINVHASLLPRYRGSSPISRAIQSGDAETGVTIMRMNEGMDTGNMLEQVVVPITAEDTAETMHDKLAYAGNEGLRTVLKRFAEGDPLIGEVQDETLATHAPMMTKEDGRIDWTMSAHLIDCQIRAFTPWPSSWTMLDGKQLRILKAVPLPGSVDGLLPGTVLTAEQCEKLGGGKNTLYVQTGDGVMCVAELQLAGKKPMDGASFLRGRDIRGKEFDR